MHELIANAPEVDIDADELKEIKDFERRMDEVMKEPIVPRTEPPTAQETLDAIEEVKEIAGKYGHEENWTRAA